MDKNELKEWLLFGFLGVGGLLLAYGLMQVYIAVALQIPLLATGFVFVILQITVLIVSVLVLFIIGCFIINVVLGFMADFEYKFTSNIENLRKLINSLSNNLAAEVLAIITAILIVLAQENLATSDVTKYSIGVLAAVYLFFSVQLIKSNKKKDKMVGVFFYIFPILIGAMYYVSDWEKIKSIIGALNAQDLVLFIGAVVTLLLAFYYSFMPQSNKSG